MVEWLLHAHHRIERALCFIAAGSERLGQNARRDLPGDAPLVFAPAARTLCCWASTDITPQASVQRSLRLGKKKLAARIKGNNLGKPAEPVSRTFELRCIATAPTTKPRPTAAATFDKFLPGSN